MRSFIEFSYALASIEQSKLLRRANIVGQALNRINEKRFRPTFVIQSHEQNVNIVLFHHRLVLINKHSVDQHTTVQTYAP
jgi:hypothetical protein